jgi:hypothetical protein
LTMNCKICFARTKQREYRRIALRIANTNHTRRDAEFAFKNAHECAIVWGV